MSRLPYLGIVVILKLYVPEQKMAVKEQHIDRGVKKPKSKLQWSNSYITPDSEGMYGKSPSERQ